VHGRKVNLSRIQIGVGEQDLPLHRRHRNNRLQAAVVAAATRVRAPRDHGVADLAGEAGRAAIRLSADHEAGTDAVGCLDMEEVGQPAAGAQTELADRTKAGVIVGDGRYAESSPSQFDKVMVERTTPVARSIGPGKPSPSELRAGVAK
jgi:hypothetical protein